MKDQSLSKKEELWNQTNRNKVDPNFFWITQTGDVMKPAEMSTSHLYNALKMIWNHTVPEECIIMPYRKWGGAPTWHPNPKRNKELQLHAVTNLFLELMNRPDRTKGMNDGLQAMSEMMLKLYKKLPR